MTLYQLVDISHVERLASSSSSFSALYDAVQLELDCYCKENGIKKSSDIQLILSQFAVLYKTAKSLRLCVEIRCIHPQFL